MAHVILHLLTPVFEFFLSRSRTSISRLIAGAIVGSIAATVIVASDRHGRSAIRLSDSTYGGGMVGFLAVLSLEWLDWSRRRVEAAKARSEDTKALRRSLSCATMLILLIGAIAIVVLIDSVLDSRRRG